MSLDVNKSQQVADWEREKRNREQVTFAVSIIVISPSPCLDMEGTSCHDSSSRWCSQGYSTLLPLNALTPWRRAVLAATALAPH